MTFDPRTFIAASGWREAKSSPHQYTVRDRTAGPGFTEMVEHIRERGYEARWGGRTYVYFEPGDGFRYWTMGDPMETTWLVNRAALPAEPLFPREADR